MKTVIFGGTTEGRLISRKLCDMGAEVTVSVVSEYGARKQGESGDIDILVGPKTSSQMEDMIKDADIVIDATHPYALEVSSNIRDAADRQGKKRLRIIREAAAAEDDPVDKDPSGAKEPGSILWVKDRAGACDAVQKIMDDAGLEKKGKSLLLTTGVRDLPFYCERLEGFDIYARVLPSEESIKACLECGIEPGNIIGMQGPFSRQLNEAIIREYHIRVMITKESGKTGGFDEKIEACRNCGITVVVISRPDDQGISYDEAVEECRKLMEKQE